MKSGPTLAAAGRCPKRRRALSSPVATVVFPTPEWVPATTTRAPSEADVTARTVAAGTAVGYGDRAMVQEVGESPARSRHCERGANPLRHWAIRPGKAG